MRAILIFAILTAAQGKVITEANTTKRPSIHTSNVTATPWIATPRNGYWIGKHESFKVNTSINRGNISVVFYGDSITEGWGTIGNAIFGERYAPLGTANYGISSDKTENLLYRIADGETDNLTPKLIVLKIGTNNLGSDTNDDIVRGIRAVIDLLLDRIPSAKLLLLGILSRTDAKSFTRIADINIKISKFHDGDRIHFLDMFNQFAVAWGVVDPSLFHGDRLHLNAAGYQRWAETMDHIFNELYQSS